MPFHYSAVEMLQTGVWERAFSILPQRVKLASLSLCMEILVLHPERLKLRHKNLVLDYIFKKCMTSN
jgi:hypothetical protein